MGVLGSIIFFGFLAAVILVPQILKSRDRQRMYDTIRTAYERGQPVPPEMIDLMTRGRSRDIDPITYAPEPSASRDLRRGIVWTAVGVGFVLIGACFYAGLYDVGGAPETFGSFAAIGAIPLCIGLAFLGLWWFGRRAAPAARAPMTFAEPVPPTAPYTPPSPTPPPVAAAPAVPRAEI